MAQKQCVFFDPNYLVTINEAVKYYANTEEEVWEIIGRQRFGSRYQVESPTGLDVYDFIPF